MLINHLSVVWTSICGLFDRSFSLKTRLNSESIQELNTNKQKSLSVFGRLWHLTQQNYWLAASQASIQSLYTSTGSERSEGVIKDKTDITLN